MNIQEFKKTIWDYYHQYGRHTLPWRQTADSYWIVVSEIMLQQTQVSRVEQKYPLFLQRFPNWQSLATASTHDILTIWQGMGYNRRALYLKQLALTVQDKYKGRLPDDPNELIKFPGIGKNTAGSIAAFAFNKPVVFIETNIRRVFIHFFFDNKTTVDDKELLPLIEKTLGTKKSREWYYALMDYGVYLAKSVINPNRKSRHYAVQSKFVGSNRQVRGTILKELVKYEKLNLEQLYDLPFEQQKINNALQSLAKEGFIRESNGVYNIQT